MGNIVAFNPCANCEKKMCSMCELNMYREGSLANNKWISVDERLPEGDERVLVYLDSKRSYIRIDTDRHYDGVWVRWGREVTHWMPLPEAPKMKGGAEE